MGEVTPPGRWRNWGPDLKPRQRMPSDRDARKNVSPSLLPSQCKFGFGGTSKFFIHGHQRAFSLAREVLGTASTVGVKVNLAPARQTPIET
jgi:hypothetical protein